MARKLTSFGKGFVGCIIPLLMLLTVALIGGCADEKVFTLNKEGYTKYHAEPAGWFEGSTKDPNVNYKVSQESIIWSIITVETIVGPILITGTQLWEPISLKECAPNCPPNK